ncbi:MAG: alpha/beta hydrolase-fold protein [Vicinamibacterales bacterium]|jgi:hypothetical protein|nr:hypothetical protein [Acidobacteriota bacterium]MDP7470979.1 alpha/beta hydrolase-fold protein [Vicinamibacterales bacterium]MDP7671621.1 alpha/beta hydrolase-fold protein [Vicinamibacterales bacterium]HJO37047.1 alpha/beta hydrolase-fold protein [Vicinamibacterales bacterium]|tara:strand:- start:3647 stop:5293 length:1647 start_codon:yes stop_codon:yes gene_type:complete
MRFIDNGDSARATSRRAGAAALVATTLLAWPLTAAAEQRFEVSFPVAAHAEPVTGRIYVMVSRTNEREPRLQIGRTGVPFFGRDVEALVPGETGIIDATDLGAPVASLRDIPAGDYFVQAFVNIYSEFRRADGHVVWMHDDQWEGQHWNRSPGNLYSPVERVRLDPEADGVIALSASEVIAPVVVPPDTEWVRRFKFQSPMLTEFWGRPVYLGATVLLPRGYDSSTINYPVNYIQGHFSLGAPNRFEVGDDLYREWIRDEFPRMILVTFQHPNPYFDDSYAVNSVNLGPYGDAVMHELIPEVERRYRVIAQPYARVLSGGSTGGWESLALQVFHPDFFGGTWSYCPDPVTFTDVEGINIYEDVNAFYKQHEWRRVPIANTREVTGEVRLTSRQRNYFELVSGTKGRSGQQLDIWSAVYGPLGEEGYFEPLFDKRTGEINPDVAEYWRDNYDLLHYLRRNWTEVGPKLVDKLRVYTGTMDNFYLNNSTRELEQWMKTTENPHYEGFFMYGDGKGHCFSGPVTSAERLREMAQVIMRRKPDGATTPWWSY